MDSIGNEFTNFGEMRLELPISVTNPAKGLEGGDQ